MNAASRTPHDLFRFGRVRCQATPFAWLSPLPWLLLGLLVATPASTPSARLHLLTLGVQFGAVLLASLYVHTLGHVLAALALGFPDNVVLITAFAHVNSHACHVGFCSRSRHIGRALGGPFANALLALAAATLATRHPAPFLSFAAAGNAVLTFALLLPVPRTDGWVVWGELLGFRRRNPVDSTQPPKA